MVHQEVFFKYILLSQNLLIKKYFYVLLKGEQRENQRFSSGILFHCIGTTIEKAQYRMLTCCTSLGERIQSRASEEGMCGDIQGSGGRSGSMA